MDYQKQLEKVENYLGSLVKTLEYNNLPGAVDAVERIQAIVSNVLDDMDIQDAKHIKALTDMCKHPRDQMFMEIDNNGGTIAMCLACGKETTELLPEYVTGQ